MTPVSWPDSDVKIGDGTPSKQGLGRTEAAPEEHFVNHDRDRAWVGNGGSDVPTGCDKVNRVGDSALSQLEVARGRN